MHSKSESASVILNFINSGALPDVKGKFVWDIGCGWGSFSRAFLELGAARVLASDIILDWNSISPDLREHTNITWIEGDVDHITESINTKSSFPRPDIIFAHLMTEHVDDLKSFLVRIAAACDVATVLFIHHDNYQQPVGHHDHGFLFLDEATWAVTPRSIPCWYSREKCVASELHRNHLSETVSWLWGIASEATKDPNWCDRCNYYRRSKPWAHLIYSKEFRIVFPEDFFSRSLNGVTPSQLELYLQQAGFTATEVGRSWVGNSPPLELIERYGRESLCTFTVTFQARRLSER